MKTTTLKMTMIAIASSTLLAFNSCNNSTDSKEVAEDVNEANFTKEKENDAEYLVSAAEINLEEIQLGQLAQKNSTTPSVIQLGKMMEDEHIKALNELQILASKKQITLPTTLTADGKDSYDKLVKKSGLDFNKEYIDKMIKGHEDAINKFEKVSTDAKDPDIQSWAATLVISLRTHLEHSMACKEECDKMKSKS